MRVFDGALEFVRGQGIGLRLAHLNLRGRRMKKATPGAASHQADRSGREITAIRLLTWQRVWRWCCSPPWFSCCDASCWSSPWRWTWQWWLGAGRRRSWRSRCLGCQDGSYTQERGENKFVHLVLLLRGVHFRLAVTILRPKPESTIARVGEFPAPICGGKAADILMNETLPTFPASK